VEVSSAPQKASDVYLLAVMVVTDELGEVRSELRLPTDLSAVLGVAGDIEHFGARVVDMSPSGMGIEVPLALAKGYKGLRQPRTGVGVWWDSFLPPESSGFVRCRLSIGRVHLPGINIKRMWR
jgi:hypothetical protein